MSSQPNPTATPAHVKEADQAVLQALIDEGLNASIPGEATQVGGLSVSQDGRAGKTGASTGIRGIGAGVAAIGVGGGESQSQVRHESDIRRYHSLLKVLTQACILVLIPPHALNPSTNTSSSTHNATYTKRPTCVHITAAHIGQAKNTLAILQRNIALRPEVLLSLAAGDEIDGGLNGSGGEVASGSGNPGQGRSTTARPSKEKTPLYKWILPRLLHTSAVLRIMVAPSGPPPIRKSPRKPNGGSATYDIDIGSELSGVADKLEESCAYIIRTIGTRLGDQADGSDGAGGGMSLEGLSLVRDGLRDMVAFVADLTRSLHEASELPFIMFPVDGTTDDSAAGATQVYSVSSSVSRTIKASLALSTCQIILNSAQPATAHTNASTGVLAKIRPQTPAWTSFCSDSFAKCVVNTVGIINQCNAEIQAASSMVADAVFTKSNGKAEQAEAMITRYADFVTSRCRLRTIGLTGLYAVLDSPGRFLEYAGVRTSKLVIDIAMSRMRYPETAAIPSATPSHTLDRALQAESDILARCFQAVRTSRAGRQGGVFCIALHAGLSRPADSESESVTNGTSPGGLSLLKRLDCAGFMLEMLAAYILPCGSTLNHQARAMSFATVEACLELLRDETGNTIVADVRSRLEKIKDVKLREPGQAGRGFKRKRGISIAPEETADPDYPMNIVGRGNHRDDLRAKLDSPSKALTVASAPSGSVINDAERQVAFERWQNRCWNPVVEMLRQLQLSWHRTMANAATALLTYEMPDLRAMWTGGMRVVCDSVMEHLGRLVQEQGFRGSCFAVHQQWAAVLLPVLRKLRGAREAISEPKDTGIFGQSALTVWSLCCQPLLGSARNGTMPATIDDCFKALKEICAAGCTEARQLDPRRNGILVEWLSWGFVARERRLRILACQIIVDLHRAHMVAHSDRDSHLRLHPIFDNMERLSTFGPMFCRETTISAYGEIAKSAQGAVLGRILRNLVLALGSPVNAIRGVAYVQLNAAAKIQAKSVFGMIAPYLPTLSVDIMTMSMEQLNEVVQILGFSRSAFAQSNSTYIVPALVLGGDRQSLDNIALVLEKHLGRLLVEHIHVILAAIFKLARDVEVTKASAFLNKVLLDMSHGNNQREVAMASLVSSCISPLLVEIVLDLGDADSASSAEKALARVNNCISPGQSRLALDLGVFLRPHMLGIISAMHERLHDVQVRTSSSVKVKILRSLVGLIKRVGSTMATYAPQIMASFQAALAIPDLRAEALQLCRVFTETLKFSDVGPNAGSIIVALVAVWTALDREQRNSAKGIIDYILVENIDHMTLYLDEIVSLEGLAEIGLAAQRLESSRPRTDLRLSLQRIVKRCSSENILVATRSLLELDILLKKSQRGVLQLAHGESFDPVIVTMSEVLMSATARDGDASRDLRRAAYSCIGALGALDPDRLQLRTTEPIVIQSGFGDPDEAVDFAMHLIQKVLVVAFRTTTNTKHQAHLGYAIQELLKFCGFTSKLLSPNAGSGTLSNKVRLRWALIQKQPQTYETIWPFLEGKFTVMEVPPRLLQHPIYPHTATYREWIQRWTANLIARVLLIESTGDAVQDRSNRAIQDAKAIFGVFRGVIRNEDVGVAHHILPHLVLYVLVFADREAASDIVQEVVAVLQEQVSPSGNFSQDRRSLSAQAIFDLLDHLSHWLSEQKSQLVQLGRKGKDRNSSTRLDAHYIAREAQVLRVSRFLTEGIDNELVAAAALRSRAYARSLRNFEERISHLQRHQKKTDDDLQAYYEHLHELYSALDEPDGMEGISTRVIAPNLDHQIREHETVGRWASAQSCWELCLQRSPDELNYHLGLMRCLRNIGHHGNYEFADTLRTHIRGVLSVHPEWQDALAPYQVESAWTLGDWAEVSATVDGSTTGPELSIGRVLLAMQQRDKDNVPRVLAEAREHIGTLVSADHRQYGRAYPAVVQLHILAEVEMIHDASRAMDRYEGVNRLAFTRQEHKTLTDNFERRLTSSLPAFKHQESILSARRAAFGLLQPAHADLRQEGNLAWISSAKIARKAGYQQTAYSAILQASDAQAAFAFLQQAKLLKETGQLMKALTELENGIRPLRRETPLGQAGHAVDLTDDNGTSVQSRDIAKAVMLQARWAAEAGRYDHNTIVRLYKEAMTLAPEAESPHYRLGHYYDTMVVGEQPGFKASYITALKFGTKYIYQTMPRLLTLWLDIAEQAAGEKLEKPAKPKAGHPVPSTSAADVILDIEKLISKARKVLAAYQWYTAFPQLVSRIDHVHLPTRENLAKIMSSIMINYPRQAVWALMGAHSSNGGKGERHDRVRDVFNRAMMLEKSSKNGSTLATTVITDATRLCPMLLRLSEDPGIDSKWTGKATKDYKVPNQNKATLALSEAFPYAQNYFPSRMILPLQDALTCSLPTSNIPSLHHDAFPNGFVVIKGLDERVDIMPSLQRPKKLCFLGDDGRRYNFLVKPHDDLRKDARLMDFNSLINKLLIRSSQSRRRNLYIRTYAVMPLNEECGLLEWVNNTIALRSILTRLYEAQRGTKIFTSEIMAVLDDARRAGPAQSGEVFTKKVIPAYQPAVFHQWFFESWPEPTAWFASRLAYARTLAVMSMVGFVLGLGDRHGENILFDGITGDTVHVDFNCLFEKGRTFEISEKVPFRLTLNLVDALGTTGVEGVYRKAAENTLEVLRANRDSLTSVLESFVHDPLVEWEQATRRDERHKGKKAASDLRTHADRALQPIKQKLRGIGSGDPLTRAGDRSRELSVQNQADALIKEATNPVNLGGMYVGWAAWL